MKRICDLDAFTIAQQHADQISTFREWVQPFHQPDTNYETIIKVTRSLSRSKDPEKIIQMTVESIQSALGVKGCALFLINQRSKELDLAASTGLSTEYLNKGTVSELSSIADSLKDGPVAVYDVGDDPRIQYPEAVKKKASPLSFPYPSWSVMTPSAPSGYIPPKCGNLPWTM